MRDYAVVLARLLGQEGLFLHFGKYAAYLLTDVRVVLIRRKTVFQKLHEVFIRTPVFGSASYICAVVIALWILAPEYLVIKLVIAGGFYCAFKLCKVAAMLIVLFNHSVGYVLFSGNHRLHERPVINALRRKYKRHFVAAYGLAYFLFCGLKVSFKAYCLVLFDFNAVAVELLYACVHSAYKLYDLRAELIAFIGLQRFLNGGLLLLFAFVLLIGERFLYFVVNRTVGRAKIAVFRYIRA